MKNYKAEAQNQLDLMIIRLRSGRCREYFSHEFDSYFAKHGIIHECTPPYSPQSTEVAKRSKHTIHALVNNMLDTPGISKAW
jgi:hypothetical protein